MKYQYFFNNITEPRRNRSSIKNCSFIFDNDINTTFDDTDNDGRMRGITLWRVDGIPIVNCSFQNQILGYINFGTGEGMGIGSINANYTVEAQYQGPLVENGQGLEEDYDRSLFEGLQYGVYMVNSEELANCKINRADFTDNKVGVYLENSPFSILTRNDFLIDAVGNNSITEEILLIGCGAHFNECSYYTIEQNNFEGIPNIARNAGLIIEDSNGKENIVYRNQFNSIHYGVAIYGENHDPNWDQDGLELKCNDFGQSTNPTNPNNYCDIYLHSDATIAGLQGSPGPNVSDPAGNRFSEEPMSNTYGHIDILNPNFSLEKYYHHSQIYTEPIESDYSKTNPENTFIPYTQDFSCPSTLDDLKFRAEKLGDIHSFRSDLELLKTNFETILNGGIKPEIMEVLLDDFAASSEVHEKLMQGSPYLSDDVLIAAITREIPLNQWHLTEILVWNGKLSRKVLSVFNQVQPLSPYLASLVLNQNGLSQRFLLELEIKQLKQNLLDLEKSYTQSAFNDSLVHNPYQKVIDLYQNCNDADALRFKISAHIHLKQFEEAEALLLEYALRHQDNYTAFKQIQIDLEKEGLNWFQMNSLQEEEIIRIANETEVYGCKNAKAILVLTNSITLGAYSMPIAEHQQERRATEEAIERSTPRSLMSLSPNPAKEWVYISYELPSVCKQAQLQVHNTLGQQIDVLPITDYKYLYKLNCKNYPPGMYFLTLLVEGVAIETVPLSLNK